MLSGTAVKGPCLPSKIATEGGMRPIFRDVDLYQICTCLLVCIKNQGVYTTALNIEYQINKWSKIQSNKNPRTIILHNIDGYPIRNPCSELRSCPRCEGKIESRHSIIIKRALFLKFVLKYIFQAQTITNGLKIWANSKLTQTLSSISTHSSRRKQNSKLTRTLISRTTFLFATAIAVPYQIPLSNDPLTSSICGPTATFSRATKNVYSKIVLMESFF